MRTCLNILIKCSQKFGNLLFAIFDGMNDSTSPEKPVTLDEVLDSDKSNRMSLDEPEESLYDFYASENNFSNENPAFDNVNTNDIENPIIDGFPLSSYSFIIFDITDNTNDNINNNDDDNSNNNDNTTNNDSNRCHPRRAPQL